MPVCSARGKLEVAGPPLLASRYQRFRHIAKFPDSACHWKSEGLVSTVDFGAMRSLTGSYRCLVLTTPHRRFSPLYFRITVHLQKLWIQTDSIRKAWFWAENKNIPRGTSGRAKARPYQLRWWGWLCAGAESPAYLETSALKRRLAWQPASLPGPRLRGTGGTLIGGVGSVAGTGATQR